MLTKYQQKTTHPGLATSEEERSLCKMVSVGTRVRILLSAKKSHEFFVREIFAI